MKQLLALALLCLGSLGFAGPPEAVLNGPDNGLAGDLIVLSWADTKGDSTKLIPPPKLANKLLINNTDRNLGFATREPGDYEFILIAVDKDLNIAHVVKKVTISLTAQPPKDPPTDPPKDPPPTPAPLTELTNFVKTATAKVNDPPTAKALAKAIRDNIDKMKTAPDRQTAFNVMSAQIEQVLLQRTGESRKAEWLKDWRIPVNLEINRIQGSISSPADAAAVMLAVADGLSS